MDSYERRETVTALAVRAKTDRAAIPELWGMVERFIQTICARYCRNDSGTRFYEHDDLCQIAYFGFLKAIDTFDPDKRAFSTHLSYYIRQSCNLEVKRHRKDPINSAISIDKPLDNTDSVTLADIISDPHAPVSFDAVELQTVVDVILAEVDRLPHIRQRRVIRECTYQGRTLSSFAEEIGITRSGAQAMEEHTIKTLRRRPIIRELCKEYRAEERFAARESAIDPYRTKGAAVYRSDFTSVVEAIVLRMEGQP